MAFESIHVRQVVRRMRGGSQPFLVEGEDGFFYIAKFAGNPQGDRTLINEWIAQHVFQKLGVSTPSVRVLQVTEATKRSETLLFQTGNHTRTIKGTLHLGSQCPVDPTTTAIFDVLPNRLLPKVVNLAEFGCAFVIDRWLGQTDSRQAIFVRERGSGSGLTLRLYVIDHGMSFAGAQWEVPDSPQYGLYVDRGVYSILDMKALCEAALSRIDSLTESDLYVAAEDIPSCWFSENDYDALAKLFASLELGRKRLRSLISRHLRDLRLDQITDVPLPTSTSDIDPTPEPQPTPTIVLAPQLC